MNKLQKLCFANILENYYSLFKEVENELRYFEKYLKKTIESMKVDEYGMKWERVFLYRYKLYPLQRIIIPKPKRYVKIYAEYIKNVPLMHSNYSVLPFTPISTHKDHFLIESQENIRYGEILYYGPHQVKWEFVGDFALEDKDLRVITDEYGNLYNIFFIGKNMDEYILFLRENIKFQGNRIYIGDREIRKFQIPEKEISIAYLRRFDRERTWGEKISFHKIDPDTIESEENITVRYVQNEKGDIFYIQKVKYLDKAVWITLEEDSGHYTYHEQEMNHYKIDIFFELLRSSSDFEIWEAPRINYKTRDHRIAVKRINMEEQKILLEREPSVKVIYPPNNTYQLRMQRDAIRNLLFRPAPQHFPILQMFQNRDQLEEIESSKGKKVSISWEFLTETDIEGTEEQRDFVRKALSTNDFTLLEGPPGSGKTTAITELIYQLLKQGKKVLLVASTHVAVDNVLEKLHFHLQENSRDHCIVPLRIGREEIISEVIQPYQFDVRKKKIKAFLNKEEWFINASEGEQDEYLNNFIELSSNLVCGTTVGILQYPKFKRISGQYFIPEFDYLIIDEASKTTFQEFIVPALHAKRWIIVGDVRQLSPYTETLQIRLLIDNILADENLKKCLMIFMNLIFHRSRYNPPNLIYVDDRNVIKEILRIFPEKFEELRRYRSNKEVSYICIVSSYSSHRWMNTLSDKKVKVVQNDKDFIELLPLLIDTEIIFVETQIFQKYSDLFPYSHILLGAKQNEESSFHDYRHLYWYDFQRDKRNRSPYELKVGRQLYQEYDDIQKKLSIDLNRNWAEELAWRIKRMQELEYIEEDSYGSQKYYKESVFSLMPSTTKEERMSSWTPYREIRKIAQIWMPSVLKCLQEGISKDWKEKRIKSIISHGFPEYMKESRFCKLSYQHRMHPEISKIPREIFYKGEALRNSKVVETSRSWDYSEYREKIVWMDVPRKLKNARVVRNTNKAEAQSIIQEMEKFVAWASQQREQYTGIILSFYERQRRYIRDLLRSQYPSQKHKQTRFSIKGVDIRVYTVDRVQGKEGDIVFLSMTQNQRVGFMDSLNRLNVALTRGKFQLVIVGDIDFFERKQKQSRLLQEIASQIKEHYEVRNIDKKRRENL